MSARENLAVPPQEAAAALLGEKLLEIHKASLQAEADRQYAQSIRDKAAKTPGVRLYQRRLAEQAAKALAGAQSNQKRP